MKEQLQPNDQPKKISQIKFGVLSAAEMARLSHLQINTRELYQPPDRQPVAHGVLDKRLGVSDKQGICETCKLGIQECPGHYGHVQLELPVFHIGYFKFIVQILQAICKTCSHVMIPEPDKTKSLNRLRHQTMDMLARRVRYDTNLWGGTQSMCKKTQEQARKTQICQYCGSVNGPVKKIAPLKIVHEKFNRNKSSENASKSFQATFSTVLQFNPELKHLMNKAQEDINPIKALQLFQNIPSDDVELLGMDPIEGRPERFILTHIMVPPIAIRPSVPMSMGGGSNEDDVTIKMSEIIFINSIIKRHIETGAQVSMIMEDWDFLQIQCGMYVMGDVPGLPLSMQTSKPIRGFAQRLKGKQGRFRGNLSGKRVDFSSRTVISPDPNLGIDEVGVPDRVAMILTYPERVNRYNIQRLRQMVINGQKKHPGANFVICGETGLKRFLKFGNRKQIADELKIGDTVERHLIDGDAVLFNRQPSLHRISIMCHLARVMPWRTFRFNECVCGPYNADFDGDEMNLHVPQTAEAMAEARVLMATKHNLITPRNGEPLIAATQDFITTAALLSRKDAFFNRADFCTLCMYIGGGDLHIDLPPPCIVKPIELWTGKQLFGILLRPNKKSNVLVNLRTPARTYSKVGEEMCYNDGYLNIRNSEVLSGPMDKSIVGGGNKASVFFILFRDFGCDVAADRMARLARLSARFIGNRGFSIGISDVTPGVQLKKRKEELVKDGYEQCNDFIKQYTENKLKLQPGCSPEESLESVITGQLSGIRDQAGKVCLAELPRYNSPMIMALCGSKGSNINISQMIACVGQQTVNGTRIPNGFEDRSLPHFPRKSRIPAAKGFVANSFYTGMTPTEFFFHTMGGREGLVDTAVKTAETGYMQRRLMKALEDLYAAYDNSVRNSVGGIVQFTYGDDGLDPIDMEGNDKPCDVERVFMHARAITPVDSHTLASFSRHLVNNLLSETPAELALRLRKETPLPPKITDENDNNTITATDSKDSQVKVEISLKEEHVVEPPKSKGKTGKKAGKGKKESASREAFSVSITSKTDNESEYSVLAWREMAEKALSPAEIVVIADSFMVDPALAHCTNLFKKDLVDFIKTFAGNLGKLRAKNSIDPVHDVLPQEREGGRVEEWMASKHLVDRVELLTNKQLSCFINICITKYNKARIEPGTAVGALGAQSIGEPGTQMTLKTFHFAGVASMNVTLGVPRIKEIINASKNISTPIIQATLMDEGDIKYARMVKGRIEKTFLGEIAMYMQEVYRSDEAYLAVKLDIERIKLLKLEIDSQVVRRALLGKAGAKLKLKSENVIPVNAGYLRITAPKIAKIPNSFHVIQFLKRQLPKIVVGGLQSVQRALINDKGDGGYNLLVEGNDYLNVMGTRGVVASQTYSNHVMEVEKVLGIEAARYVIMQQIQYTMKSHGMSIDTRHSMLLADLMTFKGEVLGITRFGIARMKDSVLMLASFEKTSDHLFDASLRGQVDPIDGVSECIIMGIPMGIGTGLFKLLRKADRPIPKPRQHRLLFDNPDLHVTLK